MKVLALLFVGTGALAYSCSGDDIFEGGRGCAFVGKAGDADTGERIQGQVLMQ